MKNATLIMLIASFCCLTACNKSSNPGNASSAPAAAAKPADAVQQKLQEYSGTSATDCGRLNTTADQTRLKTAGDCAMQASQGKHAFYVAYDMPGMTVGVAGSGEGKLFTVQAQGEGPSAAVTSGACPSQLRVASSGRVTCFAPGDMGSMSGSHAAGTMPPGMANPHSGGMENPRDAGSAKPPSSKP